MGVKKSREINLFAKSIMQGTVGCMEDKKKTLMLRIRTMENNVICNRT